jgi:hypothetical protein
MRKKSSGFGYYVNPATRRREIAEAEREIRQGAERAKFWPNGHATDRFNEWEDVADVILADVETARAIGLSDRQIYDLALAYTDEDLPIYSQISAEYDRAAESRGRVILAEILDRFGEFVGRSEDYADARRQYMRHRRTAINALRRAGEHVDA